MNPSGAPLLAVRNLTIALRGHSGDVQALHDLSFDLFAGETLAVVGESGSGKSMTALSLLGLLPRGIAEISSGSAHFEGQDLLRLSFASLREIRGNRIGMVFQEPMTSLNPVLTIGYQLTEGLIAHRGLSRAKAGARAVDMLRVVEVAEPERRLNLYPHQFSGGMRQRVMIAMAMSTEPAILIADEPTTALDVTVQAQMLDLMRDLQRRLGTSILLITHDMGVVAEMADRVIVLRRGRMVETGPVRRIFEAPEAPYTRTLLDAVPRMTASLAGPPAAARPMLDVVGLRKSFMQAGRSFTAVSDVSLTVAAGETLGLVGESGSGKSTVGRAILRLIEPERGRVRIDGVDILALRGHRLRQARRQMQMVFQDPFASLDPRMPIGRQVGEPLRIHRIGRRREARARVVHLLERVGLRADHMSRYPHEFSGGERQRIAIARALASQPRLLVADEPTSALDVSVQAQVLDLLQVLQKELGLALLLISHDMGVMARMCHRIAVMHQGSVVEMGPAAGILGDPRHAYTKALLAAVPIPDPSRPRRSRAVAPAVIAHGTLQEVAPGHYVAAN